MKWLRNLAALPVMALAISLWAIGSFFSNASKACSDAAAKVADL